MAKPLISIDTNSRDALRLFKEAPDGLARALEATENDASALMLRDFKTYPPQREGSTYKRTRTLGRAWSRQWSGDGLDRQVLIGNNENMAPYNRKVQDATQQAAAHRGRWTNTVQNVARRHERTVASMFEQRVQAEIRRLGG